MPNILKRQKAFWFLFPCALSPCTGMLGVSFLLFIGVLLRLASCLFCMVFAKKCLLREESLTILFYFISFGLFATLDLKRSPPPAPSFLSSVFCMLHLEPAHRAISPMYNKELFLCLLSFLGLVSWVLAVHDGNEEMVALVCGLKQRGKGGHLSMGWMGQVISRE